MKKLGTPIGAGPGSESEKDGFDAEGTPFPDGSVTPGLLRLCLTAGVVVVVDDECEEPFWRWPGRLGLGLGFVVDPEVVVEDELDELEDGLELELEPEPELGFEGVDDEVVVDEEVVVGSGTVGVVVDDEVGVHDSVSEVMTPWTGRLSDETGVPAGTLT